MDRYRREEYPRFIEEYRARLDGLAPHRLGGLRPRRASSRRAPRRGGPHPLHPLGHRDGVTPRPGPRAARRGGALTGSGGPDTVRAPRRPTAGMAELADALG